MTEIDAVKSALAMINVIPHRKPGFIWRKVEKEIVLFNPDTNETFLLNPTAAAIWEICDGVCTIENIVDSIIERFEADKERKEITQDIVEFIKEGEKNGYLMR